MTQVDATLLRRFAVEGCESGFAKLVERYLDLVYSAALRQVNGDSGLAADICQSVFIDLARKARSTYGLRRQWPPGFIGPRGSPPWRRCARKVAVPHGNRRSLSLE